MIHLRLLDLALIEKLDPLFKPKLNRLVTKAKLVNITIV